MQRRWCMAGSRIERIQMKAAIIREISGEVSEMREACRAIAALVPAFGDHRRPGAGKLRMPL